MILEDVPTTVAVASGKGGVGKTFVSVRLAELLSRMGGEVGLLDTDLTAPNSKHAVEGDTEIEKSGKRHAGAAVGENTTEPTRTRGIQMVGKELPDYVVNTNDERMQTESLMRFVGETDWDDGTTHVVVDTPPGTGKEIQTVLRDISPDYGYIVTTGSANSVRDACRTHELFLRVGLDHSIIVNMRRIAPDAERIRETLAGVDGVSDPERAAESIAEGLEERMRLHDDGVDIEDAFSAPVGAYVPFTDDLGRVYNELTECVEGTPVTSGL